jgi:hypothetical protein
MCGVCRCPAYRRYGRPGQRGRTLAAAACSVAAAGLTGTALVMMAGGYHGAGLVWLGLGAVGFVVTGANVADPPRGGRREH